MPIHLLFHVEREPVLLVTVQNSVAAGDAGGWYQGNRCSGCDVLQLSKCLLYPFPTYSAIFYLPTSHRHLIMKQTVPLDRVFFRNTDLYDMLPPKCSSHASQIAQMFFEMSPPSVAHYSYPLF
jgi:hypothetical protein